MKSKMKDLPTFIAKAMNISLLVAILICLHVKSDKLAIIFVVSCATLLTLNIVISKYKNEPPEQENDQCLINNEKKISGLLFGGCFDVWHVSHLLFWTLIGMLSPGKYGIVFGLSVAWETTEHFLFKNFSCFDPLCLRVEDIFLNMIGYTIGTIIRNKIKR